MPTTRPQPRRTGGEPVTGGDGVHAVRSRGVPPARGLPAVTDVRALQRAAGNGAVAGAVQRANGTGTAAAAPKIDPEVAKVAATLQTFCDTGKDVAWELYRALLQLHADAANETYGRMSTDAPIQAQLTAARTAHQAALADFDRLRQEGAGRWAAAQLEAAAANPDISVLNDHIAALLERADTAATVITSISERAWRLALEAEESGHLVAARHAFAAADLAEATSGTPRPRLSLGGGRPPADAVSVLYGVATDTVANTIGGGTYGNIASGLSVNATSGSTLSNLGTGSGAVFGPLAILCSSVNLVLGVVGAVKSARRGEELERLQGRLADPHARAAAQYALDQKQAKLRHRLVSSGVAVAGLAAGIAGCVALGVSTFGVGALVIGVVGAAIGLGLLAYRIYRSSSAARKRKMKAFAKAMVAMAANDRADPVDRDHARQAIRAYGAVPPNGDYARTDIAGLTRTLVAEAASHRELAAEGLLDLLVNGSRSQRRDAGLVLEALGLDTEALLEAVRQDRGREARATIMAKLGSW